MVCGGGVGGIGWMDIEVVCFDCEVVEIVVGVEVV